MGYPHFDCVQRAYEELTAEGKIPMGNLEYDKGLITQRAGFYSYERDSTMGVLEKSSGNNYQGYSVDILIRTNGDYYDVVTDSGGQAVPVNGGPDHDPELIPRWRKPTKELAQIDGDTDGGGTPTPPSDALQQQVDALEATVIQQQEAITVLTNDVKAIMDLLEKGLHCQGPVDLPIVVENWNRMRAKGDIDVTVKSGQAVPPTPSDQTFTAVDLAVLKKLIAKLKQ